MAAKVIPLSNYISIEDCQRVLNARGQQYSPDEIESIRTFLYSMADILIGLQKRQGLAIGKVVSINKQQNETKESHSLHTGKHRRAS